MQTVTAAHSPRGISAQDATIQDATIPAEIRANVYTGIEVNRIDFTVGDVNGTQIFACTTTFTVSGQSRTCRTIPGGHPSAGDFIATVRTYEGARARRLRPTTTLTLRYHIGVEDTFLTFAFCTFGGRSGVHHTGLELRTGRSPAALRLVPTWIPSQTNEPTYRVENRTEVELYGTRLLAPYFGVVEDRRAGVWIPSEHPGAGFRCGNEFMRDEPRLVSGAAVAAEGSGGLRPGQYRYVLDLADAPALEHLLDARTPELTRVVHVYRLIHEFTIGRN